MSGGIRAFIVGYTGETGKDLVRVASNDTRFSKLVLIGRRNVELPAGTNADRCEQIIVDYDKLDQHTDAFRDSTVGYCCLGTTRGKSGVDGFIRVDKDYVLSVAEQAKNVNCPEFHLVSSAGANKRSMFLYPKIKGEVEATLQESNWFKKLLIYRPGFLLCDRQESRPLERFALPLVKAINYMSPTLVSTATSVLAQAMVQLTFHDQSFTRPLEKKDIYDAGNMYKPGE